MSSTITTPTSVIGETTPESAPKHAPRSLWKNVSWTLIGSATFSLSRWLLVVLVAKFTSVQAVGEFTLAMAITTPVFLLSNFQLSAIQTIDTANSFRFSDFLRLRMITLMLAFTGIAAIVSILKLPSPLISICLLLAGAKCCEGLSDLIYGLFHKHEQFSHTAISFLLRAVLGLLFLMIPLAITKKPFWGVGGLAIGWLVILIIHDIPHAIRLLRHTRKQKQIELPRSRRLITKIWRMAIQDSFKSDSWKGVRNLLGPGITIGIVTAIISISSYLPFYFTKLYCDDEQLGYLAAIICFHAATGMVSTSLGRAVSPRLALLYANGNREGFASLLIKVCVINAGVGILGVGAGIVLGEYALGLMFSSEYSAHASTLVIVMVAAMFMAICSPFGFAMTAAKQFRPQVPLALVAMAITVFASLWLTPRFGIRGAAIAMMTRDLSFLILCMAFARKLVQGMPLAKYAESSTHVKNGTVAGVCE